MVNIVGYDQSNYQDGLRALVTLSAAPNGPLNFYAARIPGITLTSQYSKAFTELTPTTYAVNVKTGGPGEQATAHREAWYLTGTDNDGTGNSECEWICSGENTSWLLQTDAAIHDILISNVQALNRAIVLALGNSTAPDGTVLEVQEIHRGVPGNGQSNAFPRISHQMLSINEDHWGNPYSGIPFSDYIPMKGTIECYSLWQVDADWGFLVTELGMAVFNVLNAPDYREIPLLCNFRLFECLCRSASYQEYWDPATEAFIASFTLNWEGDLHAGTYAPSQS